VFYLTRILIRNCKLYLTESFIEASIVIDNGVVASITKNPPREGYDMVVDANHKPVIPGGIDIHAHVYDPDFEMNEDWRTGSLAAAYGGLTTLYDMPLRTLTMTPDIVKKKIENAARNSFVNYGVIAGFVNQNNYKNIPKLAEMGIRGYKVFTARPFKPDEKAYPYILELISDVNGVAIIHAEDDAFIEYGEYRYSQQDDPTLYHEHRSGYAEASAIIRMGLLALEVEARIHIAHLSSREGLDAVRYVRSKGCKITVEVTPHHLYFTKEKASTYKSYLKVAPTLKTSMDVEALWKGLSTGEIDVYASDNAPAPRDLKEKNIWEAWGGVPNLEVMIPFLYTYGVRTGRISFNRMIDAACRNPAKIMGIYPVKGEICIGCDADIVVIDTENPRVYNASEHHHKVDWSPWDKFEFYGTPIHVFVNGEPLIIDREIVGKPGIGKYVGRLK